MEEGTFELGPIGRVEVCQGGKEKPFQTFNPKHPKTGPGFVLSMKRDQTFVRLRPCL